MLEHKTISLSDQVFDHLERDILSGKYQRGEILTEAKLSGELGVSRTPVREAMRRLEQEHLIEETGKGSRVIGINEDDLEDIFLIRRKIEGIAALRAAERCTKEELDSLREVIDLQEFYHTKHDAGQIKQMDNRFHQKIYQLSGSMTLMDTLTPLHRKVQKYRRASIENCSRAGESVKEHRAVYEAIAAGDGELALKRMSEHIENAYKHIVGKDCE